MFEDLREFAIIAGIVLQLVGLAVVIYQLSRLNLSIRVSAQAAVYQQATDARSFLVQYPELRKYFFDGKALDPESPDHARAKTVAEMFLNYMEHLVLQQGSLRMKDWAAWKKFAADMIRESPIMREVMNERSEFYSDELVKLAGTTRKSRE